MNYFSSDFKLGILGGGQLGKMLLTETRKLDIQTLVLDPSEEAPSRFGCNAFYKGSLMDYDTVYQFGKMVNILTIEIENVKFVRSKTNLYYNPVSNEQSRNIQQKIDMVVFQFALLFATNRQREGRYYT